MEQIQSSSYRRMTKKSGTYSRKGGTTRKLNVSAKPISVKSKNQMKKKTSKAFAPSSTSVRAKVGTTSQQTGSNKKAVYKMTKGMKGSGKSFKKGTKGVDTRRVDQVSPAQKSPVMAPARMVSVNASSQNKSPRSNGKTGSLAMFKRSIKRTMGYGN